MDNKGQSFRAVAIYSDEVFARSEAEAIELHKRLLREWAITGEGDRAPVREVESSAATEEECYISFKDETPAPSGKYSHAYDFAFELQSNDFEGGDVTAAMLRRAMLARIASLSDAELIEACGLYDTAETEESGNA